LKSSKVADLLIEHFRSDLGASPERAIEQWASISRYQTLVQAAQHWVNTGQHPTGLAVRGITYEWLISKRRLRPLNALLTLAWLLDEPEAAMVALRSKVDRVGDAS